MQFPLGQVLTARVLPLKRRLPTLGLQAQKNSLLPIIGLAVRLLLQHLFHNTLAMAIKAATTLRPLQPMSAPSEESQFNF